MNRLLSEAKTVTQVLVEIFAPTIWVRWWPPGFYIDQQAADERVAAVRAGTRKVGIHG
ncbi:hypothetical protein ACIBEJ_34410 [Nonomuraea sp. NPDC050790]|uniref:hypothetical protein n=1 Tax=Nonomuraea sp. NPDC050790 TaxID=3364371 RepID=UPI0037AB6991